jgi:hypothetical protein
MRKATIDRIPINVVGIKAAAHPGQHGKIRDPISPAEHTLGEHRDEEHRN